MSAAERNSVTLTTTSGGAATGYISALSGNPFTGRLITLIYAKTDFADTVDFTITAEASGEQLWEEDNVTASKTVAPRQPTHDSVGVASLHAGAGEPVEDYIVLSQDRIKIVIASGGDTKTGTFTAIIQ